MAEKTRNQDTDFLFRGILELKTLEECYIFFDDLCTVSETFEMSKRLKAAKMLREGKGYAEVGKETGLSTATISRVNRCLKYGNDGYVKALERLSFIERAEKKRYE